MGTITINGKKVEFTNEKNVLSIIRKAGIKVPRDRKGNFEPKIISKYDRNAEGMEDKILSLYACGMSQRDIAEQIKSLYDVEISPELVSKISEKIMPEVTPGRIVLWKMSIRLSLWTPSPTKSRKITAM